ncbi:MAG: hypothetical protein IJY16_06330 [Clostridia bacterium]|nr:hypothetical protein [Clostridia bacterium]
MEDLLHNRIARPVLAFWQGVLSYLLFMLLAQCLDLGFMGAINLPAVVFALIALITSKFLLIYGILRNLTLTRLYDDADVEAAGGKLRGFLPHVLRLRQFQLELLPLLLLSVLVHPKVCFKVLVLLFPYLGIPFTTPLRWGLSLFLGAVTFFTAVLAKRTALRLVATDRKADEKTKRQHLGFRIFFVFGAALIVLPVLLLLLTEAVGLIAAMGVWALLIPVALVLIGVLIYFMRYLRAVRIRRRFYRSLTKICRQTGAEITEWYRPYRSIFHLGERHTFTLWHKGRRYDCQMVAGLKRRNPLYFSDTGYVENRHIFNMPRLRVHLLTNDRPMLFEYTTRQRYAFEGEGGQKILIVSPITNEIYTGNTVSHKPADVGERIGEYTLYNGSGFLNAIERDCL